MLNWLYLGIELKEELEGGRGDDLLEELCPVQGCQSAQAPVSGDILPKREYIEKILAHKLTILIKTWRYSLPRLTMTKGHLRISSTQIW